MVYHNYGCDAMGVLFLGLVRILRGALASGASESAEAAESWKERETAPTPAGTISSSSNALEFRVYGSEFGSIRFSVCRV